MKVLKSIFCLFLICTLLSSCITYDYYDENGNQVYKDYYRAIQFSYPKDWKVEMREDDGGLFVAPKEYQGLTEPHIYITVVYNEQPNTENINSDLEQYVNDIKNTYIDVEIIDYGTVSNKANNNTQYIKYKYTDKDGNKLYASDRIVFVSMLTLLATARCDADKMEQYDSNFDITLDTLTIFS